MKKRKSLLGSLLAYSLIFGTAVVNVFPVPALAAEEDPEQKAADTLWQAVQNKLQATNNLLKNADGEQIAELIIPQGENGDGVSTSRRIDCQILDPDTLAMQLLGIQFLQELIADGSVTGIGLQSTEQFDPSSLGDQIPVAPEDQMMVMIVVLFATMASTGMNQEEISTSAGNLFSIAQQVTVDLLDGASAAVTLNVKTGAGDAVLESPFTVHFYNKTHTVEFASEGLEADKTDPESVEYGTPLKERGEQYLAKISEQPHEGYYFAGWKKTEYQPPNKFKQETDWTEKTTTDLDSLDAERMGEVNLKYTAVWKPVEEHQVKFHYNNGTEDFEEITETYPGSWITPEKEPVYEGHSFAGWFTSATSEGSHIEGEFDKTITDVYAHWADNPVVTFKTDEANSTPVVTDGEGKVKKIEDPKKPGYNFLGWTRENSDAVIDFDSEKFESDTTLVPKWERVEYTISYELGDGVADPGNESTYSVESEAIELKAPVKEGYLFEGWTYTPEEGASDAAITSPLTEVIIPAGSFGNRTYKANWKAITYQIVFKDGQQQSDPQTFTYNDLTQKLNANPFEKLGYTFDHWSRDEQDGEEHYENEAIISSNLSSQQGETIYLYAQWKPNSYTVSFNPGYSQGQGTGSMETQSFQYDQKQALSENQFERPGYTFAGWKNGEKSYQDGEEVENLTTEPDGNVELMAQWQGKTYPVYFDPAPGTLSSGQEKVVIYGGTFEDLPVPERQGYDFVSWYVDSPEGKKQIGEGSSVDEFIDLDAENPSITLKADWNPKGSTPYKVEYYQQNIEDDKYSLVEGDALSLTGATDSKITAPQKVYPGFTLNGKSELEGSVSADGKTVLKLFYDREKYEITWKVADKSETQSYKYGAMPACPIETEPEPTEEYRYQFEHWDVEPEAVTQDAVYTAQLSEHQDAKIGDKLYGTLNAALEHANPGDLVVLNEDAILRGSATVEAGVTLLLPVSEEDGGYNAKTTFNPDGESFKNPTGKDSQAVLFRTLTIPEGMDLTVNGTVLVNAVTGRKATTGYDQDTTGSYSQIDLSGNIVVNSGGLLDTYGYITGAGEVIGKPGAEIRDLYIVDHWRGGSQALNLFPIVYPMNEVSMHHIESKTTLEAGASLVGNVRMYAMSSYFYTRFPQIDQSNGLIRQSSGSITKTYDPETKREKLVLDGTGAFEASTLFIVAMDLSTGSFEYPLDGDMDLDISGNWQVNERFKLMPGASVSVKNGTLSLSPKTTYTGDENLLAIYDSFQDSDPYATSPGTRYPSNRGTASLTISPGTSTKIDCDFGGQILVDDQASMDNPAVVSFAQGIETSTTTLEAAADGSPSKQIKLTARIGDKVVQAGKTYTCFYDQSHTLQVLDYDTSSLEQVKAVYDGNAHSYTSASAGTGSNVEYLDPAAKSWSSAAPTKAGTYQVRYTKDGETIFVPNGLEISKKTVGLNISGSISKAYDGYTSVPAGSSLSIELDPASIVGQDVLTLNKADVSYRFEDRNAGSNKKILISGLSLSGNDSGNYMLPTEVSANLGTITGSSSSGGSGSGGGSFSGGGSGSGNASSSTTPSQPSQSETVTNQDGSTTTTQTDSAGNKTTTTEKTDGSKEVVEEKADGSTIKTTTKSDGSLEKIEEKADGSKTTTTDDGAGTTSVKEERVDGSVSTKTEFADGTRQDKEEKADGSVETLTTKVDGSTEKVAESADKKTVSTTNTDTTGTTSTITENKQGDGSTAQVKGEISISPEKAAEAASSGQNVEITMPAIPANDTSRAVELDIQIPENVESATIEIPVAQETIEPGSVAMIEDEQGNLVPIPDSITKDGKLIVPLSKNCKIVIKDNKKNFLDVTGPTTDYPANGIAFLSARNLMTGVGDGTSFDISGNVTRAQLATILYRYRGEPDTTGMALPAGAAENDWYSKAAKWASTSGLMGVGSNFNAGSLLTREQLAMILWRLEGTPDTGAVDFSKYSDANSISTSEMQKAVSWAVNTGLMGKGTPRLNASGSSQRQELAAMLSRYLQK